MRGLPAPGADLGSPLKVVRRRQASVSSLHKAKPKATSQPGPARRGAECGVRRRHLGGLGHSAPIPVAFAWLALIASSGDAAEVPSPRTDPFTQKPQTLSPQTCPA